MWRSTPAGARGTDGGPARAAGFEGELTANSTGERCPWTARNVATTKHTTIERRKMTDSEEVRNRMRREAHEKLDEILDRKERWRYPLVVTVTVEPPVLRAHFDSDEDRPDDPT